MELFKVTAPLIEDSQQIVPFDLRVNPKKKILSVFGKLSCK